MANFQLIYHSSLLCCGKGSRFVAGTTYKFSWLGYKQWTMRHAFFADMGVFLLQASDAHMFPAFPVDGHQLAYLVKNGYVDYPLHIDTRTI